MSQIIIIENISTLEFPAANNVLITEELVNIIEVGTQGPQGIQGPPGAGGGGSETRESLTTTTVLTSSDTGTVFDNTGASARVSVELPASDQDYTFTFLDFSGFGWELTVDGETIQIGASVTTAGGTMTSQDFGSVKLRGSDGDGYYSESFTGTWIEA